MDKKSHQKEERVKKKKRRRRRRRSRRNNWNKSNKSDKMRRRYFSADSIHSAALLVSSILTLSYFQLTTVGFFNTVGCSRCCRRNPTKIKIETKRNETKLKCHVTEERVFLKIKKKIFFASDSARRNGGMCHV